MNAFLYISVFAFVSFRTILCQDWLSVSETELLKLRNEYKNNTFYGNSKSDILFLIDTSGSLRGSDFSEEKKFITNLLNEISVGMEATRVEVIPFGSTASIFIDQVSVPALTKNKCTFNEKFNPMAQSINGYMTNMKDAFQLAYDVCLGQYSGQKRGPLNLVKTTVILLTDGRWNRPSSDPSPVSIATQLHDASVEVFAVGVGNIDYDQLKQVVEDPDKQAFHLTDFDEFSELATYLRGDPYEELWQTQDVDADKCDNTCDAIAACACGLVYGDYKCACPKGFAGSGVVGDCNACPASEYKDFVGYADSCTACPANSGHSLSGSTSITDCYCFTGYSGTPHNGDDCTIRYCEALTAPDDGSILGTCSRTYLSECSFQCDEGYELLGNETRQCTVTDNDIMDWSGTTVTCEEIRCPIQSVPDAEVPTGNCTTVELSYGTRCSYYCRRGFERVGSETITCQLDKTWYPSAPVCDEITCPALSTVGVGSYSPATCDDSESSVDSSCTLICPSGYHISYLSTSILTDTRVCLVNGTWEYRESSPTCLDWQPPTINCSAGETITADNDPGTNVSTVTWVFGFTDNSLTENEPGVTEDSFTIVLTINDVNVDTNLPKLLEIGDSTVKYTVTDPAGNSATCSFFVKVSDTEPPTCVDCPADIVIDNVTETTIRVNWDSPTCTDNSGKNPAISSNRQRGDLFDVPGSYEVTYTATDTYLNKNENCSFRITLEKKQCPLYEPPANGALTCNYIGSDPSCSVQCQSGYDFVYTPPFVYYCSGAEWNYFSIAYYDPILPWPDCAKTENPDNLKMGSFPYFYYDGDCNDPNTQTEIKENFINLMVYGPVLPLFCASYYPDECNTDTVQVYCGNVTAAERRRRRSTIMAVTIRYDYVFKDTNLTSGTNDQGGQDAYNTEKGKANQTRTDIYNSLATVDWGEFQASSGLELKDKDVDNFNLGEVDAYCSADGAVVRKCDEADYNCASPPCQCTKTEGTVTKCTRCPIGTYYDSDEDDCLLCPEGTYSPSEGALQCQSCPDGTWTVGTRQENFTSCTDALLPRIVRFIKEFPQYLETVVHCARKTEVALWSYLFMAVGNPRELFTECLAAGKLETAASYLIILQNLEQPAVSKQHATILLDKALDGCKWSIAQDLVRFLRCIAADELDSPPRSPTFVKPHLPPPLGSAASMDSDDIPYVVNPHPRSSSVSKPPSRGPLTRGNSLEKGYLTRTASIERSSRKSVTSSSPTSTTPPKRPSELETADNFFIDTILNRHARLLLTAHRLRDLGRFGAYLEFALVPWLRKERNRAARVEDYIETLRNVHNTFGLPYPAVSQQSLSAPLSPKSDTRHGRFSSVSSSSSTAGGRQTLNELEGRMELGIELGEEVEEEAHLSPAYRNDECGRISGDPSETSSLAYSMDGEEDWIWGGEGPGFADVQEIRAQLAFSGSLQALREIRFLLQMFMEARCYDWWLILSLVLRDSTCLTNFIDDAIKLRDTNVESLSRMRDGIEALETWAEHNCHGYYLFFGLHKEYWLAIESVLTNAKTAPKEQKDSSPSSEPSHLSPRSSASKDDDGPGNEQESCEETTEEDKDEYECVVS